MRAFAIIFAVWAVVALVAWWELFRFHECLMVGHSRLYCYLSAGTR